MLAAGKTKFWFLAAFSLRLLSPPPFSPLVCNSFLPPMPERFCPGKKSMNVFFRDNEKKVKEEKLRAEARVRSVSHYSRNQDAWSRVEDTDPKS